jgi:hypothetical protein
MLILCLTALADELPPAPTLPVVSSELENPPEFGADFSVGYAIGTLIGNWPQPGVHGTVLARYEAFITPRTIPGPRLGLSLWGSSTLWPLQSRLEDGVEDTFRYLHYGLITAIRYDPAAPVSFTTGLGYGRLDLSEWYGGPNYLPTLTFEAGVRQGLGEIPFIDWMARVHWATGRDPTGIGFEEWWLAQLAVTVGGHLR